LRTTNLCQPGAVGRLDGRPESVSGSEIQARCHFSWKDLWIERRVEIEIRRVARELHGGELPFFHGEETVAVVGKADHRDDPERDGPSDDASENRNTPRVGAYVAKQVGGDEYEEDAADVDVSGGGRLRDWKPLRADDAREHELGDDRCNRGNRV